jgi:acid stress chaperone HdeB
MEVALKLRLLLTSAVFLFAQSPTTQAQETLDLTKITCEQFLGEKLATPSRDVVLWLTGYYHGKRNNPIIELQTIKQNEEKVSSYCFQHGETTVMDAAKNVLGFDK